ncbi:hypothetical protein K8B33_10015 [Alcanivorax sp. JB21]|uniref:hypothetical protein n=1 Tax=Alcanivorax limicola TaxID=2874102 RepID=UPI001CC15FE4|nr:hypothetical protein [Alcanivorax limicola]MBZ2189432.1 hypothetical protein [Alcanivorax limicola]
MKKGPQQAVVPYNCADSVIVIVCFVFCLFSHDSPVMTSTALAREIVILYEPSTPLFLLFAGVCSSCIHPRLIATI